jgi:DNA-binding MurR/RpiR family transcriptional regulator
MKNDELTFKQMKSCYLIVSGMSMRDVADSVGTSETTIFRWLKLSNFQDELRSLKRIVIERSLGKLQVLNDKSIQTLERLLNCGNYPTECRAAVAILTKNHESIDFFEYESRLKAIEQRFNENK